MRHPSLVVGFCLLRLALRVSEECKSVRNLCCQLDRLRHELQILLCFHDGGVPRIFFDSVYGDAGQSQVG